MTVNPPTAEASENPFALDLEIVSDSTKQAAAACITDDGCGHTCVSACASRGY